MSATKTLEMVFNLNNGNELTVSLAEPKDDITAEQVSAVMGTMVSKNAINYGGSALESSKEAYVKEVTKTALF